MKLETFTPSFFNGASLADLSRFHTLTQTGSATISAMMIAKTLFPTRPKGFSVAARNLGHYAMNKVVAENCWRDEKIKEARMYENICADIRASMPSFARF